MTATKYKLADLNDLRQLRENEQRYFEAPAEDGDTGTSPWATDWDNYIAEAESKGAAYFLIVWCPADYVGDADAELAARAIAGGECVVGNVDADDIFGFASEEARSQFAEWCDRMVEL